MTDRPRSLREHAAVTLRCALAARHYPDRLVRETSLRVAREAIVRLRRCAS